MPMTTASELIDQMTPEQMRATLHRLLNLCDDATPHGGTTPANGTLIVRTTSGGHQNLPATERVFLRSDMPEDPADPDLYTHVFWPVGGRVEDNADPRRRWALGELLWLDDPECDRGGVELEAYLSVDAIVDAIGGEQQ